MLYLIAVIAFLFAGFLGFARGLGVIDWTNFWFWFLATAVFMVFVMRAVIRHMPVHEAECSAAVGGYQPRSSVARPVPPQGGSGLVRNGYVRERYQLAERPPDPPPMQPRRARKREE